MDVEVDVAGFLRLLLLPCAAATLDRLVLGRP
jgi:hypothetical protein